MNEDRVRWERHCDVRMNAIEKLFNSKIKDMQEADKLAKQTADEARGKVSLSQIIAIAAVILSLLSLVIQYKMK